MNDNINIIHTRESGVLSCFKDRIWCLARPLPISGGREGGREGEVTIRGRLRPPLKAAGGTCC